MVIFASLIFPKCLLREGGREGKVAVIERERERERPKRLPGCPMPILTPSLSANPLTSTSAVSGKASSSVLTGQNCCVEHLKRDALCRHHLPRWMGRVCERGRHFACRLCAITSCKLRSGGGRGALRRIRGYILAASACAFERGKSRTIYQKPLLQTLLEASKNK